MVAMGGAIDDDSPADDLHELRKRGKELRYLLELFGGLWPTDVVKPMVKTLKGLQDVLGTHQDRAGPGRVAPGARPRAGRPPRRPRRPARPGHARRPARARAGTRPAPTSPSGSPPSPPRRSARWSTRRSEGCREGRSPPTTSRAGWGRPRPRSTWPPWAPRDGLRTLLWDLDPQGAASFLFRVRPKVKGGGAQAGAGQDRHHRPAAGHRRRGPRPAPRRLLLPPHGPGARRRRQAHPPAERVLEPVADHYDLAVLDCPPSISLVSESVFEAADVLLVPLIPSTLTHAHVRAARRVRGGAGVAPARDPRLLLDGRPAQAAAPPGRRGVPDRPQRRGPHGHPRRHRGRAHGRPPVSGRDRPPPQPGRRAYRGLWTEVRGRLAI